MNCCQHPHHHLIRRRTFLADLGMGFTGLALGAMLQREACGDTAGWMPPNGLPHWAPKAKSVIWLFMNGGFSHVESFDPKPMLTKYGGKTIAETPFAEVQDPKKLAIEQSRSKASEDSPTNNFHTGIRNEVVQNLE